MYTIEAAGTGSTSEPRGPLTGVRVLDLTRVVMGPFATQILADQGADVVLVEAPDGDTNRVMGPGPHPALSGIALNLLRNKRSVWADLKANDGMAFVRDLVGTCDVVVSTMRPQVLTRLGLDYEAVRRIRPDVVYCQAQGFPLTSSRAAEPAYDDIIQAATGVADVMERVSGLPGLLPTVFADKVCGLVMAQAITAALFHRSRSGEGQHVEIPMQQAMTAFMLVEHGGGAIAEPAVRQGGHPPAGYPRVLSPERRPHATKDGLIHLFPYRPQHFARLFAEAGVAVGANDHRYSDQRSALIHSDSLYRDVRAVAQRRTTEEWLEFCRVEGIPATRVVTLQELVDELPLADHPAAGRYRVIPLMANLSKTPGGLRRSAPLPGEQTAEVRAELEQS